jgi:hypothetical protein
MLGIQGIHMHWDRDRLEELRLRLKLILEVKILL